MPTLIRLFYAAAVASLLVLAVAFGVRTLYESPKEPQYPQPPRNFVPVAPVQPGGVQPTPTPEQIEFEEAQRRYQEQFRQFEDERRDYRRNVFFVAALAGIVSIAAAVALASALDAIRLGLVAGGLFCIIYAVIQARGDLDDIGPEAIFAVTLVGLVAVLLAGHRWLARAAG